MLAAEAPSLHVRGEESPVGHFRTAPAPHEMVRLLRFACATCQDWPSGFYIAYRDMLQYDLDVVFHLGDYTYEYAINSTQRGIPAPTGFEQECLDLHTYRLRHTLYKLDPDLQLVQDLRNGPLDNLRVFVTDKTYSRHIVSL